MQKKKVLLFEEDIEEGEVVSHHKKSKQAESGGFKINEEFARKFEHNKRRELLDKAKEKYGERALLDIPNQEGEGSGSEDEDEDDDGELINATVEKKFLETIAMIRSNDPKLKGLAPEQAVFKDSDFEEDGQTGKQSSKAFTYKDQIRQDVLKKAKGEEAGSSDEDEENLFSKKKKTGETVLEEEARLKKEFKLAQRGDSDEEGEAGGFTLKKNRASNSDSEAESLPEDIQDLKQEKVLSVARKKAKKELKMETDTDLLQRFYGDESQLDKTDKFLRNYILLQCWKDKPDKGGKSKVQDQIDREDEERDMEMEDFEQKYNFRFEEGTGAYITTHQREVEDSMRRKDDKRKDKRLEKKERFEEEKRRKQEELNQLKQLKKDEILEKVRKAEFISGTKIVDEASGESKRMLERMEKELKTDFIPELYDKAMEKVFDEKYYEASDQEGKKAARAKDLNLKLIKDEDIKEQGEEEEEENDNIEEIFERELIKPLKKQVEKKLEDQEAGEQFESWFACDGCQKPIEGGEFRFDCNTCDNFCFCERCYKKNRDHLHKFNRQKVPYTNKPPKNCKELIAKAYMLCNSCGECLIDHSRTAFYCGTCTSDFAKGDTLYFCLKCKKADKHEHKLTKLRAVPGEIAAKELHDKSKTSEITEEQKKDYLEGLLDEYYKLDYEDLIGGGSVKARFKYRKVAQEDFGLTEDEILLLEDRQLNKLVSIKKYRPYLDMKGQEDEDGANNRRKFREVTSDVNPHRVKHLKKQLQDEIDDKRKMLKLSLQQSLEADKEKYFKTPIGGAGDAKEKLEKLISKNRKRKDKYNQKKGEEEAEEVQDEAAEDEVARKKRKRLALYGIKQ